MVTLLATLVSRLATIAPSATRLSARLVGSPMAYLEDKPLERKLLVYDLPRRRLALINDPDAVATLLLDRGEIFPKSGVVSALLRPLIGGGVFGQPGGDRVRARRRAFIQALAHVSEAEVVGLARSSSKAYINRWIAARGAVGVCTELSRLTIDIVSAAMLGSVFNEGESRDFVALFLEYHKRASPLLLMLAAKDEASATTLVRNLGLVEIGAEMRALMRARFVDPIAQGSSTVAAAPFYRTLAEHRITASDDVLDEVAVMLLAGHETSASALSWLFWELARRPREQDAAAFVADGGDLGDARAVPWQALSADSIVTSLIDETLRLYPPIGFFLRESTTCVGFRGKAFTPGSLLVAAPWTLHRHRSAWRDPNDFCPQRWAEPGSTPEPCSFLPFGLGARACPGRRFAYAEMQEIVRAVLSTCRLVAAQQAPPAPLAALTSRPDRDIEITFDPRTT